MFNPISTYRLQFHKGFTFKDFKNILPYLHNLGVKTIYASPVFEATPGSNHGYDVVNPHRINPEIGTLTELEEISSVLKTLGISWLQDIVPNHMAFHSNNSWLMDVLENGRDSQYADFFDILWGVAEFKGKLMVPFLGSPLPDLIKTGDIRLTWNEKGLFLQYAEQLYPVNRHTYLRLIQLNGNAIPTEIKRIAAKKTTSGSIKNNLLAAKGREAVKLYLNSALELINKDPDLLQKVTDEQYYRLCFWQESDKAINYRRFFTVNSLICLNIQKEEVFHEYHKFIKQLLDKGIFQGLRVDHIDGLYDPAGYLFRLREMVGTETYIVVEKILESGEQFPQEWPVQGNTGYDFLAIVNNLLTSADSKKQFTDFYRQIVGNARPVAKSILEKKAAILYQHMGGELENLYQLFIDLDLAKQNKLRKIPAAHMKSAIAEFLIRCPIYRFYGNRMPLSKQESANVVGLLDAVKMAKPELEEATSLLRKVLTRPHANEQKRAAALRFYQRCMQFTGPLMAKGVEDTLMYTHERFIAHNEVGDSPGEFGLSINNFHQLMIERQAKWPLSLNATSTHDTKRGEDVRAKLNVLTDMAEKWFQTVTEWQREHKKFKRNNAPDANDTYLIYQTLAGAFALPGQPQDNFTERLADYIAKALREGKVNSQWAEPNENYEQATLAFTEGILNAGGRIQKSLDALQAKLADHFVINSLVQLLLKVTCPGTPDIYQGCELWDFSLVDPDNRRPVDFGIRKQQLNAARNYDLKTLWANRYTGSIKIWLTDKLLHERAQYADLFSAGIYIPLQVSGKYKDNVIAFGRRHLRNWMVVIAPLHLAKLTDQPFGFNWEDTQVVLPDDIPVQWTAVLTNEKSIFNGHISVSEALQLFPVCVLRAQVQQKRSAGIIMHITSLPSRYGIGDMGPFARQFADFLADAQQSYWQVLPVNPTVEAAGYSPYSASSSMAGNTLLISPDDLVDDGLLDADEVFRYYLPETNTVNFEGAQAVKTKLFDIAYHHFTKSASADDLLGFDRFKAKESFWLDDFALYETLKLHYKGKPWYTWDEAFKRRDKQALASFGKANQIEIDFIKWLQFKFFSQWTKLKIYSNQRGVRFLGDMPFYVSYDSVDVWTHPEIFSLDKNKNMAGIAGVPPDYFNANGQLWDMPVYRWDKLESTGYSWWIDRMKKNREFFDLIRLDHFRAFYDYWEVPVGESVAINGSWKPGPGSAIFDAFKQSLGGLPFIAEDLGDVSQGVYELRDKIGLAGMNLLHYAFGDDMPVSVHIPHNHVVNSVTYTGTHDNNTTLGWYKENTTPNERKRLASYLRTRINKGNVSRLLMELCYSSVSAIAIIPLQDVLGLDAEARMNMPSTKRNNWGWRLLSRQLKPEIAARIRRLVKLYNR
ncbi:malto-oligosyltrehalose synthase [Mucilaginibacter sp. RCC_168]|uniref:malto-oligosyltrehalose synthase n=1 Tax=Mucilaginibacter sp. RCC_168 TaxID=3239221 RepID=UPI00352320A1